MSKVEALEKGKYYKYIEYKYVFVDKEANKEYDEHEMRSFYALGSSMFTDAHLSLSFLDREFNMFENSNKLEETINKDTDEIIKFLETIKTDDKSEKINAIIEKYKEAEIFLQKNIDWINSLTKNKKIKHKVLFGVNEINILASDKLGDKNVDNWQSLETDINYRSNGQFLKDKIESTEYVFTCYEKDKDLVKGIEYKDSTNFELLTNSEAIAFIMSSDKTKV